ncbi:MAG: DUF202 domain-containing protein [Planctomycetaceae bacterium]|nr:MAG: DUF202 domain-containing protein [Planctomycetaceae bacterium]
MSDAMTTHKPPVTTAPIDQAQLALDRTILAYERTLMAWIRTALSMITLGFSLYKFILYLHQQDPERHANNLKEAQAYGLTFIAIGVFTLLLATWQHRQQFQKLRDQCADVPYSLSTVISGVIVLVGLFAFVTAILRL